MLMIKRWIVVALERACGRVDGAPSWSFYLLAHWIGCGGRVGGGLAMWSSRLDERWRTGRWQRVAR